MSLGNDVTSQLIANKQKRDAAAAPAAPATPPAPIAPTTQEIPTPAATAPVAPVENKTPEAVPEQSSKQPDATAKPKSTEQPPVTETDPPPVEEQEYKWDDGIPDITNDPTEGTESSVQFDIKKIGSALNLEVKNEQEFVTTVSQKLTKLKELEALSFDTLPEPLKLAIDVANKGGDWVAVTGAVAFDANALIPEELFAKEYERQNIHLFTNPDGTVNYEALDAELAAIPLGMKKMQGGLIKNQIVARQQQQKADVLAKTAAQQERFQKGLSEAAQDLSKILSKEEFGIAIEPKHAAYFYKGIADGSLIKKHLGDIPSAVLSKMDPKKLMATVAVAELGKKISEFNRKQGITEGKKALLKTTTNPQVHAPSYVPRPNEPEAAPELTSTQRLKEMTERQKPKNSL